ncbi:MULTISPECIES: hypothetical protein [Mogibacterium]|jgi:hypothetical protein|uniref:Uncharacterized protein n=1 Tax=Mogibacterium timidum TaxID=35519 RepID=A0A7Y9B155_9FIRM|nr:MULTISPECIES: hypothetical protein [Mogibacterium]EJU19345.1 hypothetical protein HMPREF1152_0441 [Mogibacterium sp. CM50]NWO23808.1 hypothetical protein [Mogibacterium timidum]
MLNEILHYIVLSLAGSVALVVMSKIILNKLLRRDTGYYESIELDEEAEMLKRASIDALYPERSEDDVK